jgi:hypothetical protein
MVVFVLMRHGTGEETGENSEDHQP